MREAVLEAYEEGGLRIEVHRVLLHALLEQHAEGASYVAANHAMNNVEGCWDASKPGDNPCWACQYQIHGRGRDRGR